MSTRNIKMQSFCLVISKTVVGQHSHGITMWFWIQCHNVAPLTSNRCLLLYLWAYKSEIGWWKYAYIHHHHNLCTIFFHACMLRQIVEIDFQLSDVLPFTYSHLLSSKVKFPCGQLYFTKKSEKQQPHFHDDAHLQPSYNVYTKFTYTMGFFLFLFAKFIHKAVILGPRPHSWKWSLLTIQSCP